MGMGIGLFEELVYDGPQLVNGSILDYRVPRFSDLPKKVELHLVQNQDGVGPYGAKGGGEASLNSMAANIANAVDRATGVRIREAPLTHADPGGAVYRSEEHTSELQSRGHLVCRLLLEKKKQRDEA